MAIADPRTDVNSDTCVDAEDIWLVRIAYGTPGGPPFADEDVNEDGAVNILDIIAVANAICEED